MPLQQRWLIGPVFQFNQSHAPTTQALGAHPLLFGQFPAPSSSAALPVILRSSLLPRTAIHPATRVQLRPVDPAQGTTGDKGSTAQQQQFWATRLKDMLLGQAVFPGLALVFESFGARVAFEVRTVTVRVCVWPAQFLMAPHLPIPTGARGGTAR